MTYLAMIPRQAEPLPNSAMTMCSTVMVLMPVLFDSCKQYCILFYQLSAKKYPVFCVQHTAYRASAFKKLFGVWAELRILPMRRSRLPDFARTKCSLDFPPSSVKGNFAAKEA